MFEKEAKEYAHTKHCEKCSTGHCEKKCILVRDDYDTFQDGAEFGYNKANEWHYPSKGELPKEDAAEKETLYLLWFGLDDSDYMTGVFSHGRFWCFDSGWFDVKEVVAWKEIVPPKEENK